MNTEVFLEHLGRGSKIWIAGFLGFGGIGEVRVALPQNMLSPIPNSGGKLFKPPLTPLTAVCYLKCGKLYPVCDWRGAAENLEIPVEEARQIECATSMLLYERTLRQEMLGELGLLTERRSLIDHLYIAVES